MVDLVAWKDACLKKGREDAKGNRGRVARKEVVGYFCGDLSAASNQSKINGKGVSNT